jgi:acyl-CoA thioesterase FadM
MRFSVREYVRWEDIDAAGIINYQAYLRFWLPRVHVECDFFHPVKLDELLIVEAFFGKIGKSSIHLDFVVRRSEVPDVVVATGNYVLVSVARGEFRPTPVPEIVRDRLKPYVEEG